MTDLRIYTPESVDLQLEVAGLGSRSIAFLLDLLIQLLLSAAVVVAGIATGAFNATTMVTFLNASVWSLALLVLLLALIWLGLPLIFEVVWRGQTVGKRVVGLRVVAHTGLPASVGALIVRNLLRLLDQIPLVYTLGTLAIWLSPRRQRLGDLAAGTLVIRERTLQLGEAVPVPQRPPTVPLEALAPVARQTDERLLAAVRSFLGNRKRLALNRRFWLADRLALQVAWRGGWQGVIYNSELFLEDLVAVRSGQWQPGPGAPQAVEPPRAYWRPMPLPGGERFAPPWMVW